MRFKNWFAAWTHWRIRDNKTTRGKGCPQRRQDPSNSHANNDYAGQYGGGIYASSAAVSLTNSHANNDTTGSYGRGLLDRLRRPE